MKVEKPKHLGWAALGVVAALTTSFFAGGVTAHKQLDVEYALKPEHVKIQKIETEVIKRELVPTVPESCLRAIELAQTVDEAFGKFDGEAGQLKDVAQGLGAAIAMQELKQLNAAKQKLFDYSSDTAGIVRQLGDARKQLKEANTNCIADTNP